MSSAFTKNEGLKHLVVRPAIPSDVLDLLDWRNDPYVRAMSRQKGIINMECHQEWFKEVLNTQEKLILIGVLDDLKIGMVRFDKHTELLWEVSIILAPSVRGKNISRYFLNEAISFFCLKHSDLSIFAEIKKYNEPSIKLFKSLNFSLRSQNSGFLHYYLTPDNSINRTSNLS